MEQLTVTEMDERLEEIRKIQEEYKAAKEVSNALDARLKDLKYSFAKSLEAMDRTSYASEKYSFSWRKETKYALPEMGIERDAFFGYLRDTGVIDSLMTVNSNTLNSWAKQELKNVEHVPGLVTKPETIAFSFRKK